MLFTDTRTHGQTGAQSDCNKPLAEFNYMHAQDIGYNGPPTDEPFFQPRAFRIPLALLKNTVADIGQHHLFFYVVITK